MVAPAATPDHGPMPSTSPSTDAARLGSTPATNSLSALAAATPASRDRYVDFLRGLAIAMVAVGHWLVVVPTYRDGSFDGVNALDTVPLMRGLTWVFQVMPLFFMVGGYANARSWRSAVRRGEGWSAWVRTRFDRLLRPTVVFLGAWVAVAAIARQVGVDAHLVHTMAWLVVVPLWFLAVYVVIVALAPAMLRLHERFGGTVLVALVAATTLVDVARIGGGHEAAGYLNFLFVFLFCQQLGFFWLDGRLAGRRWWPTAMLTGGLVGLWLLTHVGPYPTSLVGVPHERIANNAPPTVTFLALAIAQAGLVLLLRAPVSRWLRRPRAWAAVIGVNAHAMTIHLWHFTALVVVALALLPLGIVPVFPDGTASWWSIRLLALPVLAVPLAALVAAFGRVERRAVPPRPPIDRPRVAAVATAVSVPCLSIAFALITVGGLSVEDAPAGVPFWALGFLGAGLVLLRVGSRRRSAERERSREEIVLLAGVDGRHPGGR
jgi:fucose 4-O-acetylase-like acetyltransferase